MLVDGKQIGGANELLQTGYSNRPLRPFLQGNQVDEAYPYGVNGVDDNEQLWPDGNEDNDEDADNEPCSREDKFSFTASILAHIDSEVSVSAATCTICNNPFSSRCSPQGWLPKSIRHPSPPCALSLWKRHVFLRAPQDVNHYRLLVLRYTGQSTHLSALMIQWSSCIRTATTPPF
jgi:hypothetical protein